MMKGTLFLIPNTLGSENFQEILPAFNLNIVNQINHYIVENERNARRFLIKCKIETKIDDLEFFLLNKHTDPIYLDNFLKPALEGNHIGLISEAGCPAIADPGAMIVQMAHDKNILVKPLIGPSSILLALIASGLNGQSFQFHGYLPIDKSNRLHYLRKLEKTVQGTGQSQIFMETPYRNNKLLQDILHNYSEQTRLCIASNITTESESIQTIRIFEWKRNTPDLNKIPTVFIIGL